MKEGLKIFGFDEDKKNKLYSQLINACKGTDIELYISVFYNFFKTEIEENVQNEQNEQNEQSEQNEEDKQIIYKRSKDQLDDKPDNGLSTYLCEKFMILIGYEASDCYKD